MARTATALRALAGQRALVRVLIGFALFALSEYATWIGMLVYAYARGGATESGLVALAQLAPGIVIAPVLSTLADRYPPGRVLAIGYLAQFLGMAATAVAIYLDAPPGFAYAAAVFAATAVSVTRPAMAPLLPALATGVDALAAANAAQGWLDSVGVIASGTVAGLALATGQQALVFAICAGAAVVAAALTVGLTVPAMRVSDDEAEDGTLREVLAGLRLLRDRPQPRLLVALATACYVVIGALDVLMVVLAVSVLRSGQAWVGYLNTAEGIGGLAATGISLALVGRRLTRPVHAAAGLLAVALTATAFSTSTALTAVLLALTGLSRVTLDVAIRTLLQRSVPSDLLGRIFGVVEGLSMAGLALGSVLVPALMALGGAKTALIAAALILPSALILGRRSVRDLDSDAYRPVTEIALLRAMPHFRLLPTPAIDGLARVARRVEYAGGDTIIRQGDEGDRFYAIAEGRVRVLVDGHAHATRGRPEGLGEIALLRRVPRSATVVADGPVVLYAIDGDEFVTVLLGHGATRLAAEAVASGHLDGSARTAPA